MRFSIIIFLITIFLIVNIYNDGFYIEKLKSFKKYFQMVGVAFIGLSLYLFIKKDPKQSKYILTNANNILKYIPIDKNTRDFISPIINFSTDKLTNLEQIPQNQRMMNSGKNNTSKRCVSETKKKFVASSQNWNCGDCKKQLPAWFEVDHKIRLDKGGNNNIENLVALCRNCHGKKTAYENL